MGYSVKILTDSEYEKLPYSLIKESFAVTSPDSQNIYVRYSNVDDFNKMLISHEMDHLVEEVPTDVGPDGERYFSLGGLLGGIGDFLGNIWGGVKKVGSSAMNLFSPAKGSISMGGQPDQTSGSNGFPLQKMLGAGMLGYGLLKGLPNVQNYDPKNYMNLMESTESPLSKLASGKLTEQLNRQFQPMTDAEMQAALRPIEESHKQEIDRVNDMYHNLRPGSDITTDSAWKKDIADVDDYYTRQKSDIVATRTRDLQSIFNTQQITAIQQAITEGTLKEEQLIGWLMTQYGMDYQQAAFLKESMVNMGTQMLFPEPTLKDLLGG